MFREDHLELPGDVVGEQIAEEVIVENRSGHVVARSGSSARERTKVAWS